MDHDQDLSCEEHINCSVVLEDDLVVHIQKVQVMVERQEEMTIAAIWVTEGVYCCKIGFLPHHTAKYTA
jgi:hypothetical protein